MKLRNKKTGEIGYLIVGKGSINYSVTNDDWDNCGEYNSLAELNAEWEDYKENKDSALNIMILTLSNFIENEPDEDKVDLEDWKQMLEELKALRRLKDNGFKFEGIKEDYTRICQEPFRTGKRYLQFNKSEDEEWMKENWNDLDILFRNE